MDLYASRSWDAMRRDQKGTDEAMVGPRALESYIQRPPEELFDLENDPLELCNLAGDPQYRHSLESMRWEVEQWQRETKDLWLWRDGISMQRFVSNGYSREGLQIPDRFDVDVSDASGEKSGVFVDLR